MPFFQLTPKASPGPVKRKLDDAATSSVATTEKTPKISLPMKKRKIEIPIEAPKDGEQRRIYWNDIWNLLELYLEFIEMIFVIYWNDIWNLLE